MLFLDYPNFVCSNSDDRLHWTIHSSTSRKKNAPLLLPCVFITQPNNIWTHLTQLLWLIEGYIDKFSSTHSKHQFNATAKAKSILIHIDFSTATVYHAFNSTTPLQNSVFNPFSLLGILEWILNCVSNFLDASSNHTFTFRIVHQDLRFIMT